ncbi:MAG: carboxypeptidase-like regulatory domain-containing protein [Planctomycetaceae bacterium]|jgi:hypothetical protein|nr:carboxypeptidase-like regulatory domain-containing protein [Planctomycetaceae bacterium]
MKDAHHSELTITAAHPDYISLTFIHSSLSDFIKTYQLADNSDYTTITLYPSAKVTGTVLSPSGKPAAAVLVYASSLQDGGLNGVQTHTRTDKEGKFTIGAIPGQNRLLWILPNDAAPLSLHY